MSRAFGAAGGRTMLNGTAAAVAILAIGCQMEIHPPAREEGKPLMPVVASEWFRIIETHDHHLNDFCVFQDQNGLWHAMGIMGTGTWRSEQSLFHAVGQNLCSPFEMLEPILSEQPAPPLAPQKHAPYVVYFHGQYHLFYRRPPGTILHVQSADPGRWTSLGKEVFSQADARDICMVRIGNVFYMYYCQLTEIDGIKRSCILARQSKDLINWQEPSVVYVDTAQPARHSYLESPFVIQRREGFYLFIRHRLYDDDVKTVVLFSRQPDEFPSGKQQWFAELSGVHAPEIVSDGARYYLFRVSGPRHASPSAPDTGGWLEVAELAFR